MNSSDSESLATLAQIDFIEGRVDDAVEGLRKAIKIAEKPPYLIALGTILERCEKEDEAKVLLDRARSLMKEEAEHPQAGPAHARERAKFLLARNENLPLALQLAKDDLKLRKDLFSLDLLAWAYFKNGQLDNAQATIKQVLAISKADPGCLFHAGMIEAKIGNRELAKSYLAQAVQSNPYFSLTGPSIARNKLAELSAK